MAEQPKESLTDLQKDTLVSNPLQTETSSAKPTEPEAKKDGDSKASEKPKDKPKLSSIEESKRLLEMARDELAREEGIDELEQPQSKLSQLLQSSNATRFKIVVVGEKGVGKCTLLRRHNVGESKSMSGVKVYSLPFLTSLGSIVLDCWTLTGEAQPTDSFYLGAHGSILMFDVTARVSYKSIPQWHREVVRVCENIPIVLCGNKVDCKDRRVKPKDIFFHRKKNLRYWDISAKANYNIEKPFLWILQKLAGDPSVTFSEAPAWAPPEEFLDSGVIAQYEETFAAMDRAPLEDEDDEDL